MDELSAADYVSEVCAAMRKGDLSALRALSLADPSFPAGADPWLGVPWVAHAVESDSPDVVRRVIEMGANPSALCAGYTMLQKAVESKGSNRSAVMGVLIDAGADVDQFGMFGYTAVHLAAEQDDVVSLEYLASRGADVGAIIQIDPIGAESCRTAIELARARNPAGEAVHWLESRRA